jgi:hypothetical protein
LEFNATEILKYIKIFKENYENEGVTNTELIKVYEECSCNIIKYEVSDQTMNYHLENGNKEWSKGDYDLVKKGYEQLTLFNSFQSFFKYCKNIQSKYQNKVKYKLKKGKKDQRRPEQ